mmetsp:Transcript_36956/g.42151  ORF Transcript_36956/g.42151 Transcript_36956/m.42151 type:complete len:359 (-) Transcript_36956:105-1181(-)
MNSFSYFKFVLLFTLAVSLLPRAYSKAIKRNTIFGLKKKSSAFVLSSLHPTNNNNNEDNYYESNSRSILETLRGGASSKSKKKKKKSQLQQRRRTATGNKKVGKKTEEDLNKEDSVVLNALKKYREILPMTRLHLTIIGISTALGMLAGDELMQQWMSLDSFRVLYGFEMWRPITAISYLGPPSIGWLMSLYHLFQNGSSLERAYGMAQFLWFQLTQLVLLSLLGSLFRLPFTGQSLITAMLHVLSRAMPFAKVKWLVFTVPNWALPLGFMASDVLQAKSAAAAIPHVVGMLTGHYYHFHKFIWPKMNDNNEDWLNAPQFLIERFEEDSSSNSKDAVNAALSKSKRRRSKKKGRKLGK